MATAPAELRSLLIGLSNEAQADLAALWAQFTAQSVTDGLFDALPALVAAYGDAAAAVAAEWYDEYRDALNVAGAFSAELTTANLGADALTGWGVSLARKNWDTALPQISGGLVKRVMTAGRQTVVDNVESDPKARGWMRVGRPECAWCAMLISRGSVYRTRDTSDFAAHDNCKCGCCPAWDKRQVEEVRSEFVPSARRRSEQTTEADQQRAKQWIAGNL